jgi:hypothetical protein
MSIKYEALAKDIELNYKADSLIRARIIHCAIAIDRYLEEIIARHFCADETKLLSFRSIFTDAEISFSQKTKIAKKLIKNNYPDIYAEISPLFNKIDKLRELRNKMAHCELVIPDEPIPSESQSTITIRYYKDGEIKTESFTKKQISEIAQEADMYGFLLSVVYHEIQKRISPAPYEFDWLGAIKTMTEAYQQPVTSDQKKKG